jgi:hypothetical protein
MSNTLICHPRSASARAAAAYAADILRIFVAVARPKHVRPSSLPWRVVTLIPIHTLVNLYIHAVLFVHDT